MSSLWMNVVDFIFWLFQITNLPLLIVLTPLHLPYTPSTDCAHLFVGYVNSFVDYENTYVDYINFLLTMETNLTIVWIHLMTMWILLLI
jgi:hypothetical protein